MGEAEPEQGLGKYSTDRKMGTVATDVGVETVEKYPKYPTNKNQPATIGESMPQNKRSQRRKNYGKKLHSIGIPK